MLSMQAKQRDDLLAKYSFAVPVFHAYGHKAECQVQNYNHHVSLFILCMCVKVSRNPRNIPGYTLSDGEAVERLWSYLRRFSAMTKEMRPAHRVDVLSHALLHYSRYACDNIGLFA